ncbi:MAG: SRPBCC family protein [bacterium]|nr:SRPBCC family protein [bacterium]
MVDVTTDIIIKRPLNRVFEYASNPEKAPEWYVNIKSVEWKSSKPLTLGSRFAFKAQFLGRQLEYTYEIVELLSGQKLVMRTADGPFLMETTYVWEKIDNNTTRMTLRNRGNPTGFSKLLAPFMAFAMKKANQKDLARLKEIIERQ